MYVQSNNEARSCNHCCSGKAISITCCVCVCVCVCACVCSLTYSACNVHAPCCQLWPAALSSNFPRYLINGTAFVKTLLSIKYLFWFSLQHLCETFLNPRRNERSVTKYVHRSSREVLAVLVRFSWNLNFLGKFSQISQISIISIPVPRSLYYFVLWPTNAQLFHKLSHSYMFRHYRVILSELVINTLPTYTSISNAAVSNTI